MAKGWKFKPVKSVTTRLRKSSARGLALAAEHVLGESNAKVPLEEGTLERSGTVSLDEKNLRAAISYDTPYATVQHEDLTLSHTGGREAKFLENAINGNKAEVLDIVARTVQGEW
ncbi:minor capsid protein [Citricoccus sp.]|uniref:minor capsid protein n=1 Tax=Citricoccus sp. TaxID=1978372 RepID=UPI0028BD6D43|nr:minor capsid protein [Citricoccus sp.]